MSWGWQEMLGGVTAVLALVCYVPYFYGILWGSVRPHTYTYVVWTLVPAVAVAGAVVAGGGPGTWGLVLSTVLCAGVLVLSLRYGTHDVTRSDVVFLWLALASAVPWILTKDPTLSVVMASLIELLGSVPTYRKTWRAPDSESLSSWSINTVKHMLSIPAMATFSVATLVYPVVMVVMNGLLVVIIVYRGKAGRHAD